MFWIPKVVSWAESPFFEKKVWESSGLKQEHDVRLLHYYNKCQKKAGSSTQKRVESGKISKLLVKTLKVNVRLVLTVTLNENL